MKKSLFFALAALFFTGSIFSQDITDTFGDGILEDFHSKLSDEKKESGTTENLLKGSEQIFNAAEEISPEEEYYFGRALAAKFLTKYEVLDAPFAQAYLNLIVHSLAAHSERPVLFKDYSVVILDSDEINAFATCGGHIMVTRGLLRCASSEDSLAAVLAHELSHILLQHSVSSIKVNRIRNAVSQILDKETFDKDVEDVLTNGYSHTQEFEADAKALELLYATGYNVQAMDKMLLALEEHSVSDDDLLGFGKTHPNPKIRRQALSQKYKKYGQSKKFKENKARKKRFEAFKSLL